MFHSISYIQNLLNISNFYNINQLLPLFFHYTHFIIKYQTVTPISSFSYIFTLTLLIFFNLHA